MRTTRTTDATRQVIYTYRGDHNLLAAAPTLVGLSVYLSADKRSVTVRAGYSYTFTPEHSPAEVYRRLTERTTVLSMRTGILRCYTTVGRKPFRQVTAAGAIHLMLRGAQGPGRIGRDVLSMPFVPATVDPFAYTPSGEPYDSGVLLTNLNAQILHDLLIAAATAGVRAPQKLLDAVVTHHPHPPLNAFAVALAYPWQQEFWLGGVAPSPAAREALKRCTAATAADLARVHYGPKATRPVVKAFAARLRQTDESREQTANHRAIQVTTALRSLLDPDSIASLLAPTGPGEGWGTHAPEALTWARNVLRRASPARRKRLAAEMISDPAAVGDTHQMAVQLADRLDIHPIIARRSTWVDIHDDVVHVFNRHQAEMMAERAKAPLANFPTAFTDLDGHEMVVAGDTYRIEIPDVAGKLTDWGAALHHCIGSYITRAATGDTLLFALHRNGELYATGEVNGSPLRLCQLAADRNQAVLPEVRSAVVDALAEVFTASRVTLSEAERARITAQMQGPNRTAQPRRRAARNGVAQAAVVPIDAYADIPF